MLSLKELNEEIEKLENKEYFNFDICHKLATLYTIRKCYYGEKNQPQETPMNIGLEISKSVK